MARHSSPLRAGSSMRASRPGTAQVAPRPSTCSSRNRLPSSPSPAKRIAGRPTNHRQRLRSLSPCARRRSSGRTPGPPAAWSRLPRASSGQRTGSPISRGLSGRPAAQQVAQQQVTRIAAGEGFAGGQFDQQGAGARLQQLQGEARRRGLDRRRLGRGLFDRRDRLGFAAGAPGFGRLIGIPRLPRARREPRSARWPAPRLAGRGPAAHRSRRAHAQAPPALLGAGSPATPAARVRRTATAGGAANWLSASRPGRRGDAVLRSNLGHRQLGDARGRFRPGVQAGNDSGSSTSAERLCPAMRRFALNAGRR